jgi:hypothetical protein
LLLLSGMGAMGLTSKIIKARLWLSQIPTLLSNIVKKKTASWRRVPTQMDRLDDVP